MMASPAVAAAEQENNRRLAFASPLNNYSPQVFSTYDPARLPSKSLLARQSVPSPSGECYEGDDAERPMLAVLAPGANEWAVLLGEFAVDGLLTFGRFQSALLAGDESKVPGLTDVLGDAHDLWVALVGDRSDSGAVEEIAELLSIACSERLAARASFSFSPSRGSPDKERREDSEHNVEGDEDMCNVETDSLDDGTAPNAEEDRALQQSMQRLKEFIGAQPRASREAISLLEGFLAKDSCARGITVPVRAALTQPAHMATAANVDEGTHARTASPSLELERTHESAPSSIARWLEQSPSPSQPSLDEGRGQQLRDEGTAETPVHNADEVLSKSNDKRDEQTDDSSRASEHWRALEAGGGGHNPGVSSPWEEGERGEATGWTSGTGQTFISPQPAPAPQPHMKTPQQHLTARRSSLQQFTPQFSVHDPSSEAFRMATDIQSASPSGEGVGYNAGGIDSPGSRDLQKYTHGTADVDDNTDADMNDQGALGGEEQMEGQGDTSFSFEAPLTAWGANDFDRCELVIYVCVYMYGARSGEAPRRSCRAPTGYVQMPAGKKLGIIILCIHPRKILPSKNSRRTSPQKNLYAFGPTPDGVWQLQRGAPRGRAPKLLRCRAVKSDTTHADTTFLSTEKLFSHV